MLELSFKIGNTFKTTDEVANKFRNMIMQRMKMALNGGGDEYQSISAFCSKFEAEFKGLEN